MTQNHHQPSAPQPQPQQPYPTQPQYPNQAPPTPQEPVRHHVHHSYIWLGSIQVAATILVVIIISLFSSVIGSFAEGESITASDVPVLLIVGACIIGGFILLVGLVALAQWLSYKHLYYELSEVEFNLYSGIFSKKRVHVPYQRIQSVDQRASLLQRIFGVCTLNIDTAGGSANKAVSVPYVQKAQAEELRAELFARKQYVTAVQNGVAPDQAAAAVAAASGVAVAPFSAEAAQAYGSGRGGAPIPGEQSPHNVLDGAAEIWDDVRGVFGGMSVDTGKVTYEYGMNNKELVFTGLTNSTAFVLIVIGIMGAVAQFSSQIIPLFLGDADPLVGNVVGFSAKLFGGNLIAAGVAGLLFFAAIGWVVSIIGTCISYGGFRARRRDNRIEVEHGLLQHQFQGVSIDRVQSVIVKQSFIRRLFGYCELSFGKIDATNSGEEGTQKSLTQGLIVHPFVKMSKVPEILAGLAPEFADIPTESIPVAKVALRRALIRNGIIQGSGFGFAILIAVAQLCANTFIEPTPENLVFLGYFNLGAYVGYSLCVALFVVDLVGAVLWARGSSFAYNKHFMQVSNGGLSRETVSFARKKIQFGYTKTNPFQRNAHTVTVHARTAAGVGGTTVRLIDACEDDAKAWLDWLKPRGNVVE